MPETPETAKPRELKTPELIVALDVPTLVEAERLIDLLRPEVGWFKVGLELFTAWGADAIRAVRARGGRVFLDVKLHDIPETVVRATRAAGTHNVDLLTIHAAAGEAAWRGAAALPPGSRPRLLAVTVLTSDSRADAAQAAQDAGRAALQWGADGLVSSPAEAAALRAALGTSFLLVTPGIRPAGTSHDDHARAATPAAAIAAGASFLVVGRPIRDAADPKQVALSILSEIRSAHG